MNEADFPVRNEVERRERLVVVSNRLPFTFRRGDEGRWRAEPAGGGLVTALLPVLRHRGGVWVGWTGASGEDAALTAALDAEGEGAGFTLKAVPLSAEEVHDFYLGFSNEIVWPLFHDLQSLCNFEPAYWRTYCAVNRRYARVVAENVSAGRFHLGPRLPPDERGCRAAPGRRDLARGLLPAHTVPAAGPVLQAAVAQRGVARAARVRSHRFSDAARPPQFRAVRAHARRGMSRSRGGARCCACRAWGAS